MSGQTRIRNVLVTGGSGFVGSRVVRKLVDAGYCVAVMKRPDGDAGRLKGELERQVQALEADLVNTEAVDKAVASYSPEAIVHLAGMYVIDHRPSDVAPPIRANVLGTMNLLEAAAASGAALFINTSTCAVYKPANRASSEDDELAPGSVYALTKLQAEQACALYANRTGLASISFRIFAPYGPDDHERRLIPMLIRNLSAGKTTELTTGAQAWDFVHVDDVADAYLAALDAKTLSGHTVLNLGSGCAVTVREVGERVAAAMGRPAALAWGARPHRKDELWFSCAATGKIRSKLGWSPRFDVLTSGLEDTMRWYTKEPSHAVALEE